MFKRLYSELLHEKKLNDNWHRCAHAERKSKYFLRRENCADLCMQCMGLYLPERQRYLATKASLLASASLHDMALALYWQNLPKTRYLVNLRTIWEAMGNASKNFFALEGAPYMVYPYSHVKLFDNIKTSGCNSQKRCHATSGKLRPVYCVVGRTENYRNCWLTRIWL